MEVRKAVITAAGRRQRQLPLQRIVDADGHEKSALRILIDEVLEAGIEDIALVIAPGDAPAYEEAAGGHAGRLHFIMQPEPLGYGQAVLLAAEFAGGGAFLHLVGDHLWISHDPTQRCARQLVEQAAAHRCAVSAVQAGRERALPFYGVVGGRPAAPLPHLYEVERVLEKPSPTDAERLLVVPGLRAGWYLCLFGMHVLTPTIFRLLREQQNANRPDDRPAAPGSPALSLSLTDALSALNQHERHLACELRGTRFNIGEKYGLFFAQLGLATAGDDRDEVLTRLVDMLATREMSKHLGRSAATETATAPDSTSAAAPRASASIGGA